MEKYKVVQILVNLINNAKQACAQRLEGENSITIRVSKADEKVTFQIADTGVGIAPAHLEKYFSTASPRENQAMVSAFHDSCLTARELNGELRCQSEGPNLGASLTLILPVRERAQI